MSINKSLLVLAAIAVLSSSAAFAADPAVNNNAMTSSKVSAPATQKHVAKKGKVKAKTSKKASTKKAVTKKDDSVKAE